MSTDISVEYRSSVGRYIDRYIGRGVHKIHMIRPLCICWIQNAYFFYLPSQTSCIKFPWFATGCTNCNLMPHHRDRDPEQMPLGWGGEMGTGGIDWCMINYLKNNWMAPQTIEIGLWILRRCSYWYVTTIHRTNNSWKATKPFKTICHLNSSYTWLKRC